MLSFVFVFLWQLTAAVRLFPTLVTEYDFTIHAKQIAKPIARLSMSDATKQAAQNARTVGQVDLSSVNLQCIKQLLAYNRDPLQFVFPQRMISPAKDEKILKEEGVADLFEPFQPCNDVINFLVKSSPRDISREDYVQSSNVKLKQIWSPQPALQLYVKSKFTVHKGYARMQFAIEDLKNYRANAMLRAAVRGKTLANRRRKEEYERQAARWAAEGEEWADQELAREREQFAEDVEEQIEEERLERIRKDREQAAQTERQWAEDFAKAREFQQGKGKK